MIFVPSRGRRRMLEEWFAHNRPILPGRVLIDDDDGSYMGMKLPAGWEFFVGPRDALNRIMERAARAFPGETFYGSVGDDMRLSAGWDRKLAFAAGDEWLAYGDDGINGERLSTFYFIGARLVMHMGFFAHSAFGHLYADTVWHAIATGSGRARYLPEVKARHIRIHDLTFLQRRKDGDAEAFAQMKSGGELERLIEHAKLPC